MANPKIQYEISANSDQLANEFKKVQDIIGNTLKDTTSQISGFGGNIGGIIEKIKGPFLALTGILAGGKIFKEAVGVTKEWTGEVSKLSRTLAIGLTGASAWATMLHTLGVDIEEFQNVVGKLELRVVKNADAFDKWKVATRDASGGVLGIDQVILNITDKYDKLGTQQEKNAMLAEILGKSWMNFLPMVRANSERLAEARKEAEAWGMVVDKQGQVQIRDYKEAMNKLNFAFKAFQNMLGKDVIPILTDLAGVLLEVLKPAFEVLGPVLKIVMTALDFIVLGAKSVWRVIEGLTKTIYSFGSVLGAIWQGLKTGDFSQVGKAWDQTVSQMSEGWSQTLDDMGNDYGKMVNRINDRWNPKAIKEDPARTNPNLPEQEKERILKQLELELEAMRVAEAKKLGKDTDFYELSKKAENDFWKEKQQIFIGNSELFNQLQAKVDGSRKAMRTEELAKQDAQFKLELEQNKFNYDNKLMLAQKNLERLKGVYKDDSAQVLAAEKEIETIKAAARESQKKIEEQRIGTLKDTIDAELGLYEDNIKQLKALNIISGEEELTTLHEIAQKRIQLKIDELEQLYNLEEDAAKRAEIQRRINAAKLEQNKDNNSYNNNLNRLGQDTTFLGGIESYINQSIQALQQWGTNAKNIMSGVENAFSTGISGILSGNMTLGQGLSSIWKGIGSAVIGVLSQMAAKWLVTAIAQKIFGIQTVTTAAAIAQAQTASSIEAGAAGAWQAYGWIPFVGAGLAMAQIAMMIGSVAGATTAAGAIQNPFMATALAVGGRIDTPTLALMGEAGPEIVAPESSFKDWANKMVSYGVSLNSNIAGSQDRASYFNNRASGYASDLSFGSGSGSSSSGQNVTNHFDLRGSIVPGSHEFQDLIGKTMSDYQKRV